jgi:hypothetical protein
VGEWPAWQDEAGPFGRGDAVTETDRIDTDGYLYVSGPDGYSEVVQSNE